MWICGTEGDGTELSIALGFSVFKTQQALIKSDLLI